jgi:ribulose 1,5-bisphosphate synthetase/thiazole synthase
MIFSFRSFYFQPVLVIHTKVQEVFLGRNGYFPAIIEGYTQELLNYLEVDVAIVGRGRLAGGRLLPG